VSQTVAQFPVARFVTGAREIPNTDLTTVLDGSNLQKVSVSFLPRIPCLHYGYIKASAAHVRDNE
jgi:hypothetical protein